MPKVENGGSQHPNTSGSTASAIAPTEEGERRWWSNDEKGGGEKRERDV